MITFKSGTLLRTCRHPSTPIDFVHPTQKAVAVRRRADLKAVETRHKHESAVVVKDPIAMKYHRMRPDEFFVLEKLDGHHSLEQIKSEYERVFAPAKVTTADLNQLLFRFHQLGLTLSDAAMQGDRLSDRRRQDRRQRWLQHISGILFIRFPGVDPEPLLKRIYPLVRPMLGWFGMLVALTACLVAAVSCSQRIGIDSRRNFQRRANGFVGNRSSFSLR